MNRAERLAEGDQRRQNVGFALQILQRRLASSPAAIHESLRRRRERLERRVEEARLLQRGRDARLDAARELDRLPPGVLRGPRRQARGRGRGGRGATGRQRHRRRRPSPSSRSRSRRSPSLEAAGQDAPPLRHRHQVARAAEHPRPAADDRRRGQPAQADHLHRAARHAHLSRRQDPHPPRPRRGRGRDPRRRSPARRGATPCSAFLHDPAVLVMVANDAAGEGVNLQRAHLMVNYDLPWNPNRLEQRFGRIHRIGQTEVCHLWNLVAHETREGAVYARLLEKLEAAREALGGRVYDVLGQLFEQKPLQRPPDRGDPLRRAARGQGAPAAGGRRRGRPRPPPGSARAPRADPGDLALQQGPGDPRADGAGARPAPPAPLHRELLPRGLRAPGRPHPPPRDRPLRDHPRARALCASATARSAPARRSSRATSASASTRPISPGPRSPPSSAPATRCSTPPSTSPSSATAI